LGLFRNWIIGFLIDICCILYTTHIIVLVISFPFRFWMMKSGSRRLSMVSFGDLFLRYDFVLVGTDGMF